MTEEPVTEPAATAGPMDAADAPSTELVVRERYPVVAAERRWPRAIVRTRAVLLRLRENPAAVASLSAAATVASALLTAGLRRAVGGGGLAPARRTTSVAVHGHVLHEVHVVHHVVHHVMRPPAP